LFLIRDIDNLNPKATNNIVALGKFDGIHLGHKAVLETARSIAQSDNLEAAIVSFEPSPVQVIHNIQNCRITDSRTKVLLLKSLVDRLFLLRFNKLLASTSAHDFVHNILLKTLKAAHIVIGYDFVFGRNREGDSKYLQDILSKHGVGFTQVTPLYIKGEICSSTNIRKHLAEGNIKHASLLLGRDYSISGRVERGLELGREISFPTANISLKDLFRVKYGVYAVNIIIENEEEIYQGVANIGCKPTVNKDKKDQLEVHIFNFSRNIYGKRINVILKEYIREEEKFTSLEELKNQIIKDCLKAQEILNYSNNLISEENGKKFS
jgi:riboflavin kinase/FMN adenylyltransferase